MMTERRRATYLESVSSRGKPNMKGRGERLINDSCDCKMIGNTFVSGTQDISIDLCDKVSKKACDFFIEFRDPFSCIKGYHCQGGFIRGEKLVVTTTSPTTSSLIDDETNVNVDGANKKDDRTVSLKDDAYYEAIPLTAKHNWKNSGNERYIRAAVWYYVQEICEIKWPVSSDGGCCSTNEMIQIRPATTKTTREVTWCADEILFGEPLTFPSNTCTNESRLFELLPNTFKLCEGHKIGLLVYRTYDITHEHAQAPLNIDLLQIYGEKLQVCIYTGTVTEISSNGLTFCHNINTFQGCSGAIIFLLDQNDVDAEFYGRAVGINVGGLDSDNNLGFLLNIN